jgi:hypothetical protein|tara:strand:+ start:1281 stop:1646 length:366 start_codon:yes stop_codon:yes gene_type:complete
MGLAWFLPDTESTSAFFHFLPQHVEPTSRSPSNSEIEREEKSLLTGNETGGTDAAIVALIELREEQKDWNLGQLPSCVEDALDGSPHLHCPPTISLISPQLIDLIERLHNIRPGLLEKLRV